MQCIAIALHCFPCDAVKASVRTSLSSGVEIICGLFCGNFMRHTVRPHVQLCIQQKSTIRQTKYSKFFFFQLSSVQYAVAFSSMKDCNAMALLLLLLKVFQIAREENAEHCTVQRLFRVRNNLSTGRSMQHTAFGLKSRGPWSLVLF